MSALVWSVESAVLGIWALVFSLYSTPFHAFIARSHAMISGLNLILQLVSTARDLEIGHAISEAFVCAVSALFLVYIASILDTSNHKRFFSMPSAGILPLDAVFGVAWFCAAIVSSTGMALSEVGKGNKKASLMFHQYGYHTSIVLPSFLILWLYNYDANNHNEPVYKSIAFTQKNKITITHSLLFTVYACIWGWYVISQFLGERYLNSGKPWPSSKDMSCGSWTVYLISAFLKFLGRGGCVLIPLSAAFTAHTYAQTLMAWTLVGVSAAYALDILGKIERLFGFSNKQHQTLQSNAGAQSDAMHSSTPSIDYEFTLPGNNNTACIEHDELSQTSRIDPAAVALNTMSSSTHAILSATLVPPKSSQWRRDKMV
jgi:hypothetical protein